MPSKKASTKSDCPRGKILNPDTGRCVSKTGKKGQEILAKQTDDHKRQAHDMLHNDYNKNKYNDKYEEGIVTKNGRFYRILIALGTNKNGDSTKLGVSSAWYQSRFQYEHQNHENQHKNVHHTAWSTLPWFVSAMMD